MKSLILCVWICISAAANAHFNYVLKSNAQFTQNIYKTLSRDPGNFVFSPLSAHSILSMLYQGAEGETKLDIATNLYLPDPSITAMKYNEVLNHLNVSTDVKVSLVNKLYVDRSQTLKSGFFQAIRRNFLSTVELVDFSQPQETANEINRWVEDHTNQKIRNLCEASDFKSPSGLVAVNTLYFKGEWKIGRLSINRDIKCDFNLEGGGTTSVSMMSFRSPLNFKDDEAIGAKVLEMPFKDDRFSIVFVLPKEGRSLAEIEDRLSERKPYGIDVRSNDDVYDLTKVFQNLTRHKVRVRIPPFSIEKSINLEGIFQELGLGSLFNENECDLSGITDGQESLYVNKAVQKVVINVNENGCEAATASSGFSLGPVSLIDCEFVANHPFLFSLIERSSDGVNILFTGRVSNPIQTEENIADSPHSVDNIESPLMIPDTRIYFPQPQRHPRKNPVMDMTSPLPIARKLLATRQ